MPPTADPSSLLPLGPSAFYTLLAMAEGERHGYAISKEVEAMTGGTVRLTPTALYRYLKQMVIDGWIVETDRGEADGGRRRYYRLTPWGRQIAQAEAARLEDAVRTAHARNLLPIRSAP